MNPYLYPQYSDWARWCDPYSGSAYCDEPSYSFGWGQSLYPTTYAVGARGGSDWSGTAKIALLVGGALAAYFIYRASEGAKPVAKKLGNIAGSMMAARTKTSMTRGNGDSAQVLTRGTNGNYKLLTA